MPDWVTHLGTTYMATQATLQLSRRMARWMEMRHVLLGALLPDGTRFSIILVDMLDWPAIPTFTYFIPFHSLLIVTLLAGAVALLLPAVNGKSGRAFGLLMTGAAFHFLLDDVEGWVGCGSTTFYPFYFGKPISGWSSEGNLSRLLLVISAVALGLALGQQRSWPPLRPHLSRTRLAGATVLLVVACLLPWPFRQRMIEANAYFLGFIEDPTAFEGQPVELCFSEVVATGPTRIEEFDRTFVLRSETPLAVGEWVSLRGMYRQGTIDPVVLIRHQGFSDITLSLVAAGVFILLMFGGYYESIKRAAWYGPGRAYRRYFGRRRGLPADDHTG